MLAYMPRKYVVLVLAQKCHSTDKELIPSFPVWVKSHQTPFDLEWIMIQPSGLYPVEKYLRP